MFRSTCQASKHIIGELKKRSEADKSDKNVKVPAKGRRLVATACRAGRLL